MEIISIVAFPHHGSLDVSGNGTKLNITLTQEEADEVMQLARSIFNRRQSKLVETVSAGLTALPAPIDLQSETIDDVPF